MKILSTLFWLVSYVVVLFTGIAHMAELHFDIGHPDFHIGVFLVGTALLFLHKVLYGKQYIGLLGMGLLTVTLLSVTFGMRVRVLFVALSVFYLFKRRKEGQIKPSLTTTSRPATEKDFWEAPLK